MTNDQMRPNRFGRWAKARHLYGRIIETLRAGGTVTVATATQYTHYRPKHIDLFKVTPTGVYVQHGKRWDCIDYCGFRFTS